MLDMKLQRHSTIQYIEIKLIKESTAEYYTESQSIAYRVKHSTVQHLVCMRPLHTARCVGRALPGHRHRN